MSTEEMLVNEYEGVLIGQVNKGNKGIKKQS